MIRGDKYEEALEALRLILVRAKFMAYEAGAQDVADLLNDAELLPEHLAGDKDMTDDFREVLAGIVQIHPTCRHILEQFERAAATG